MAMNKRLLLRLIPLLFLPCLLLILFYCLRHNWVIMLWWTENILPFLAQGLGRISALFPFALGEVLLILLVVTALCLSLYRVYRFIRKGDTLVNTKLLFALLSCGLWLWTGMCWLWNVLYYVPTLAQRSNLEIAPYAVEELVSLTHYFAQGASEYSSQVSRNEDLQFNVPKSEYFQDALTVYDRIEEEFPFLAMEAVKAKSLTLSYLQSYFGFTGVYNPFTGEANINIHCPAVLHPVTIAHEMAHQRLIAPELEANFLSIVACLSSENPTFRYSGYLFGLIQLSNALYPVNPEAWQDIVAEYFTPELATDWQSNYLYWQSFQSPAEDAMKEVYDGFLKSNDQDLGIRSYGACVDLLVAYYK